MNFKKFFPRVFSTNLINPHTVHSSVVQALIRALSQTSGDIDLLLSELCITSATGTWLNEWGSWFGVKRLNAEPDSEYRSRILASIHAPKSTISALQKTTSDYLNSKVSSNIYKSDDIIVFEPHKHIKTFSQRGGFDMDCRYPDDTYWRRNVVDIELPENPDETLNTLINNTKAAGIKVVYTLKNNTGLSSDFNDNSPQIITDNSLVTELPIYKALEGLVHSCFTPQRSRQRSGKQNLFGIDKTVMIQSNEIIQSMRLAGTSWIYQHIVNNQTPIVINRVFDRKNPAQFSVHRGMLSSVQNDFSELAMPPVLPFDAPVDLLMDVQQFRTKYKPHIFSGSFGGFDAGHPLSGVFGGRSGDKWNGKTINKLVDMITDSTGLDIIDYVMNVVTELHVVDNRKSRKLSGNQISWSDSQVSWETPLTGAYRYADDSYLLDMLKRSVYVEPFYVPSRSVNQVLSSHNGDLSGSEILLNKVVPDNGLPEGHERVDVSPGTYRVHQKMKPFTISDAIGGHSEGHAHSGLEGEHYKKPTMKQVSSDTHVNMGVSFSDPGDTSIVKELSIQRKYPKTVRPRRSGSKVLWVDKFLYKESEFDLSHHNFLGSPLIHMHDLGVLADETCDKIYDIQIQVSSQLNTIKDATACYGEYEVRLVNEVQYNDDRATYEIEENMNVPANNLTMMNMSTDYKKDHINEMSPVVKIQDIGSYGNKLMDEFVEYKFQSNVQNYITGDSKTKYGEYNIKAINKYMESDNRIAIKTEHTIEDLIYHVHNSELDNSSDTQLEPLSPVLRMTDLYEHSLKTLPELLHTNFQSNPQEVVISESGTKVRQHEPTCEEYLQMEETLKPKKTIKRVAIITEKTLDTIGEPQLNHLSPVVSMSDLNGLETENFNKIKSLEVQSNIQKTEED